MLAAIRADPKAAREKHGRSSGLGTTYHSYLSGEGRVITAEPNAVSLSLAADRARPDVVLLTGLVFGNAIRDGTGLLSVNDYPNSRDFNDISAEINRCVEGEVIPPLREKAVVGSTVKFVGCAEVADESTDLAPRRVVPISAVVR